MCRIAGFWDTKNKIDNKLSVLRNMRDTLAHGGPDDAGEYLDEINGIALGHRRLSIIDLSQSGHQPMKSDDGRWVIVYNGEFYNFKQIRSELIEQGYRFNGNSDTEVVLKSYICWGVKAFDKFRGMFAFAIWDNHLKEMIIVRDRVGVKPLYYSWHDGMLIFASELKAFKEHPSFKSKIDTNSLALFFQYAYIPAPYSIFENVKKLMPGTYIVIGGSDEIKEHKYWDIKEVFQQQNLNYENEELLVDMLEQQAIDSFGLRMVSDVPVGVFLSGGIDSSLVTSVLNKHSGARLNTFTMSFDDSVYDEGLYAKKIADYLGTKHTEFKCRPTDVLDILPKFSQIYDEPFGDRSALPTFLLCQKTAQNVKVALSADGGDEFCAGYHRYAMFDDRVSKSFSLRNLLGNGLDLFSYEQMKSLRNHLVKKWPNKKNLWNSLINLRDVKDIAARYERAQVYYQKLDVHDLGLEGNYQRHLPQIANELSIKEYAMLVDAMYYLPDDIMTKVDRASMSVALELREPMLDNKFIEMMSSIPLDIRCKGGEQKYILKKLLARYLPSELYERPKQGFGVPLHNWLKNELRELCLDALSSSELRKHNLLNGSEVDRLVSEFYNESKMNRHVNPYQIWLILVFQMWYKEWFHG